MKVQDLISVLENFIPDDEVKMFTFGTGSPGIWDAHDIETVMVDGDYDAVLLVAPS